MLGHLQIGAISATMTHMVLMDRADLQAATDGRVPIHPLLEKANGNLPQTAGKCISAADKAFTLLLQADDSIDCQGLVVPMYMNVTAHSFHLSRVSSLVEAYAVSVTTNYG